MASMDTCQNGATCNVSSPAGTLGHRRGPRLPWGGGQERENGSRPDHLSFNRSASWQRSSVCRPRRRCRVRDGWRWMVEKPQKGKKSPKILLRRLLLIGPYQPAPKKPSPLFLFTQILRFHHCRSRKSRYELPLALPIFQTGPPDIWRRGE